MSRKSRMKWQISRKFTKLENYKLSLFKCIESLHFCSFLNKIQWEKIKWLTVGNCKLKLIRTVLCDRLLYHPVLLPLPLSIPHTHGHTHSSAFSSSEPPGLLSTPDMCPVSSFLRDLALTLHLFRMNFPLFLASLTLFTSAHFFRAYSPTKCFLGSGTKQRHSHGDVRISWLLLRCVHCELRYFLVLKISLHLIKGGVQNGIKVVLITSNS